MDYRNRLFKFHPEWGDISGDDDMLEARNLAREKIDEALFNEQGACWDYEGIDYRSSKKHLKVSSVNEAAEAVLAENGINVSSFLNDWALSCPVSNNALIIELAVIYLAKHFITQKKRVYNVECTWHVYGNVKVYANNKAEATQKARLATNLHDYNVGLNPYEVEIDSITDPSEEP